MLSKAQEKYIRSLHTKKGRSKHGRCLVEGQKLVDSAEGLIDYTFTSEDTHNFDKLVTTTTPQSIAAVARTPEFTLEDVLAYKTVLILDGVQDPGNVGTIFRLCQGFEAGLILVESADPTNPKTLRSSAGAIFHTPWASLDRSEAEELLAKQDRAVFRLEKREKSQDISLITSKDTIYLVAGSEGSGIQLNTKGASVVIPHNSLLESMNVGNAVAIALFSRFISKE